MDEHEAEAVSRSTIREQIAAIGYDPVEEAILSTECMARLEVPLDTPLGDLTAEQLGAFADWLNDLAEEMRHQALAVERLAAIRRERKG